MKIAAKEQRHVRTALRFLRYKVGGWQPLADALGMKADSIGKVLRGGRDVTPKLAYSVARLTDVSVDELLSGGLLSPRTCPHCGRAPNESEFVDEETMVERDLTAVRALIEDDPSNRAFAEQDFEGPYELGHAVFNNEYGVYLLVGIVRDDPATLLVVYVGRGHFRQQLAQHATTGRAQHFYLKQFPTATKAFREECRLFHKYGALKHLDNRIHPLPPAGTTNAPRCPVRGCEG